MSLPVIRSVSLRRISRRFLLSAALVATPLLLGALPAAAGQPQPAPSVPSRLYALFNDSSHAAAGVVIATGPGRVSIVVAPPTCDGEQRSGGFPVSPATRITWSSACVKPGEPLIVRTTSDASAGEAPSITKVTWLPGNDTAAQQPAPDDTLSIASSIGPDATGAFRLTIVGDGFTPAGSFTIYVAGASGVSTLQGVSTDGSLLDRGLFFKDCDEPRFVIAVDEPTGRRAISAVPPCLYD